MHEHRTAARARIHLQGNALEGSAFSGEPCFVQNLQIILYGREPSGGPARPTKVRDAMRQLATRRTPP